MEIENSLSTEMSVNCDYCPYFESKTFNNMMRHVKTNHPFAVEELKCEFCNQNNSTKAYKAIHEKRCKSNPEAKKNKRKAITNKLFDNLREIKMLKQTEKIEKEENLIGEIFEEIIIDMNKLNKNNIDNFLVFMIDNEKNIEEQALKKLGNINVYLFILQIDTICVKFFFETIDNQELIDFQLYSVSNHHIAIESIRNAVKDCNNMLEEKGWKNSGLKFKSIEEFLF